MNQVVTEGIILSRTNFGEADRILTILTPDHGRIRAIAKGVRKIKSKLAGGIELFSVSQITFIKGKGEIYTLISTRLKRHFGNIPKDINRTMYGYEVLKLLNKNLEDNAGQEYFDLLSEIFKAMNDLELKQDIIDLWLSAQLLKLAGHSPNLKTSSKGELLNEEQNYNFDIEKMSFYENPSSNYNSNHIKLLRLAFNLNSPAKLNQVKNIDEVLAIICLLTKNMLKQYIRI